MRSAPGPWTKDLQRTLCSWRLINGWVGDSPMTESFIRSGLVAAGVLAKGTAATGFILRERRAIYSEFSSHPG